MRHALTSLLRPWRTPAPRHGNLLVLSLHQVLPDDTHGPLPFFPFQPVRMAQLQATIDWLHAQGWQLPHPGQLHTLRPDGNYALLTFDDGYANNLPALQALSAQGVPWLLFPTLDNVLHGKAYWWDIIWRVMRDEVKPGAIAKHIGHLKAEPLETMEETLCEQYGPQVLLPEGDLDRPLTPAELQLLAADPMGAIGYHGYRHAAQPTMTETAQAADLQAAHAAFAQLGITPLPHWAYPNGDTTTHTAALAQAHGLQLGFGTRQGTNPLPRLATHPWDVHRIALHPNRPPHRHLGYWRKVGAR
jgi:peptidoglycan/xylan/chitin deacetylase (PgdA/CDA1 family)